MADMAQIGFAADTSDLTKATSALQALVPATKAAETAAADAASAVADVGGAAKTVQKPVTDLGKATNTTGKIMQAAGQATKAAGVAAKTATPDVNKHAEAHKGLSTQAMAAQHSIRSMAEGLLAGQPATQVLTQQLNHLTYAASGPGGLKQAFSDGIGIFTQFLTKGVLVAAGVLGIAAALVYMVGKTISSMKALDDLSTTTGVAIGKLNALQQSMAIKGIDEESFTKGMESFSQSVDQANHGMGSLATLMRANGKSASDLQGYLYKVADLIKNSADGAQRMAILREAGLPADAQWVRYMAQGGDALKAANDNASKFNEDGAQKMIDGARKFDEAWASAITNVKQKMFSWATESYDFMDRMGGKIIDAFGGSSTQKIEEQKKSSETPDGRKRVFINGGQQEQPDKKTPVKTAAEASDAISKAQQQIALLGDLATTEEKVKQKQLELAAAGLQGVGVSQKKRDALMNEVRAQSDQQRVTEQATIGIYNSQLAYKASTETLQNWIDKGLVDKNNANQMAAAHEVLARQIRATKEAAEVAAAPLQQLKQLELDSSNFSKLMDTSVTGALNNLVSPIQDVMNGVTGIKDGFKNMAVVVLKAIEEMIIKMLVLAPIAKALQSTLGGGGIASLFGFKDGGAVTKNALGNSYPQKFAGGGDFTNQIVNRSTLFSFANGTKLGEMGEAGPEAIVPLKRGSNGSLGVQMHGGGSSAINLTHAPTYNIAQGANPDAIRELKSAIADDRKKFAANAVQAVASARQRNAKV